MGREGHVAPNEASSCHKASRQMASIRHVQFQSKRKLGEKKKVLHSLINVHAKAGEHVSGLTFDLTIHSLVSWCILQNHPHTSACEDGTLACGDITRTSFKANKEVLTLKSGVWTKKKKPHNLLGVHSFIRSLENITFLNKNQDRHQVVLHMADPAWRVLRLCYLQYFTG